MHTSGLPYSKGGEVSGGQQSAPQASHSSLDTRECKILTASPREPDDSFLRCWPNEVVCHLKWLGLESLYNVRRSTDPTTMLDLMQITIPWSPSLPAPSASSSSRPSPQQAAQHPHHHQPTHSLSGTTRINLINHTNNNNIHHTTNNSSSSNDLNNTSVHSSHSSLGGSSACVAPSVVSTPRRTIAATPAASSNAGEELRALRMQQLQWMVLNAKVEAATKARTHEVGDLLLAMSRKL